MEMVANHGLRYRSGMLRSCNKFVVRGIYYDSAWAEFVDAGFM